MTRVRTGFETGAAFTYIIGEMGVSNRGKRQNDGKGVFSRSFFAEEVISDCVTVNELHLCRLQINVRLLIQK